MEFATTTVDEKLWTNVDREGRADVGNDGQTI